MMINSLGKSNQLGLSLVELMVSMLIASIVLAGVFSVVQSSRMAFSTEQESAFVQENMRYATELLTRDIRMAGSSGCASRQSANFATVTASDFDGMLATADAVAGYEGSLGVTGVWPAAFAADAEDGSDAVILRYSDPDTEIDISAHDEVSANMSLLSSHSFAEGDKLMVVDASCRYVGVFENTSSSSTQISHTDGGGNCTTVLRAENFSFSCGSAVCSSSSCTNGIDINDQEKFTAGSIVGSFVVNGYYVGESRVVPGTLALKRQVLTSTGTRSEELAQGVEKMELQFGVDLDVPMDSVVNSFQDADLVADWNTVIAVRFSIVFRSQTEVYDSPQAVTILGVDYNDKYLRQLSSATVRLRNR